MGKSMFKREDEEAPQEPVIDEVETVIGPSVRVEGNFMSNGNIAIEGTVKGTIKTTKDLRIGETANIEADIEASNITTSGTISGTIKVHDTLDLKQTGKIYGDVQAGILSVETGAILQGNCLSGKVAAEAKPMVMKPRRAAKSQKDVEVEA
jgi:cytoskeletal protein CcmA (bactofilin family)